MSSSNSSKARFIFFRHGQSVWNAEKRLAGQADVAVSEAGREQVRQMKATVQALRPQAVICSDLRRARESAALLGYAAPPIDPRLREANLGQWEGEFIANLPPEQYQAWRVGRFDPPQGETWQMFCDRVETAVRELAIQQQCILVVTHGGVIRAVCERLLGLSPQYIVPVNPASATIIDLADHPRLTVFNMVGDVSFNGYN